MYNTLIYDNKVQRPNFAGAIMQMIFNPGTATGPNKSDNLDADSAAPSPWANLISMGLKILTAILGGGASSEGIDKVDNGSPMQVRIEDYNARNHNITTK